MQELIDKLEKDMIHEIDKFPNHSKKRFKLLYMNYHSIIRNYQIFSKLMDTPNYNKIYNFMNHKNRSEDD